MSMWSQVSLGFLVCSLACWDPIEVDEQQQLEFITGTRASALEGA